MTDGTGSAGFKRADVARLTGCNLETVRYYEKIGLLPPPPRGANDYRLYDHTHIKRLRFILRGRALGFSIDELRGLLGLVSSGTQTCAEVRSRTALHLVDVRAKIADLVRIETILSRTIAACTGDTAPECAILDFMDALE